MPDTSKADLLPLPYEGERMNSATLESQTTVSLPSATVTNTLPARSPSANRLPAQSFEVATSWKWTIALWLFAVHALALVALPMASATNVLLALGLWFVTGCLGVTIGFHRLFSHRSFRTSRLLGWFFALCGSLAFQGGVLEWVARHRMHHAYTDTDNDPHNARRGFWHSHILWLFAGLEKFDSPERHRTFARDIYRDPVLRIMSSTWTLAAMQIALLLTLALTMGWDAALWGVFVRLCAGYHCTWLVNSATHKWGYRNYETQEDSRNCWWVALVTFGEGWHNNHHADDRACRAGRKPWEFDLTYVVIRSLAAVGLVGGIVPPREERGSADPSAT